MITLENTEDFVWLVERSCRRLNSLSAAFSMLVRDEVDEDFWPDLRWALTMSETIRPIGGWWRS